MATVLYVDDQEAIGRAVKLWLSRKGHVIHLAATASEAQAMVTSECLDGVFIDLWLGTESGLELYDWIDALEPELARRVAFVTGDLFDKALANLRVQRPVLAKPFELHELEALAIDWHAERVAAQAAHHDRESDSRPQPDP